MTTKEIATIDKEVTKLVTKQEKQAVALEIATIDDMKGATELLSEVNRMADKFESEKELLTKPLNAALKEIRSRYKPIETALENAVSTIRGKMMSAQKRFDAEIALKQEKLMARVEKGTMKVETAVNKMEAMPDASAAISTNEGSVRWMTVKKLEVTDMALIPFEYFDLNEVRLKEALKKGVIVPGAVIIEEKVPANSR